MYKGDAETFLRYHAKQVMIDHKIVNQWTSHKIKEVMDFLKDDAPQLWESPPIDIINLKNGLYDLNQHKLLPHRADHFSIVQLPVVYNPKSKCPGWDKFITGVYPKDAQSLAYEITAWLMSPFMGVQSAILLLGEGSNGKSTFLNGMQAFLGASNFCSFSLHKLETDRFATAQLLGKLANICPDLPNKKLESTSILKALTGGDSLIGEHKFKNCFTFKCSPRLVFSANEMPSSTDYSEGFFRRWIIVPFEKQFKDNPALARKLSAQLASQDELSGLLNKAIEIFPHVLQDGITISESMREIAEENRLFNDPVALWIQANIEVNTNSWEPTDRLYDAYIMDQQATRGVKAFLPKNTFGKRFQRVLKDRECNTFNGGALRANQSGATVTFS